MNHDAQRTGAPDSRTEYQVEYQASYQADYQDAYDADYPGLVIDEEVTGFISPAQLAMEQDLGLGPNANLPAPPEDCEPYPYPDNSACAWMSPRAHHLPH